MPKRYLYDYGLPFSEKLAENLIEQISRVEGNKASLIIIDGLQGEGKTTLLVECMDYINSKHGLPEVSLKVTDHPQLAMGGRQFISHLRICEEKKLVVLGYDEAGDFNKRGSMSSFNQMLNNVFSKFRGFKIIIIIALPNFNILDNWLFDNGIPRGLLHLKDRNQNYGSFDAYSLAGMNWIRYWYDKLSKGVKHKCYGRVQPSFRGHFFDLTPTRSKQLDLISTRSKRKALTEEEIRSDGLINYNQLAKKVHRSVIWVRKVIAYLNIRHVRIINRNKYFDDGVINILLDHLEKKHKKVKI